MDTSSRFPEGDPRRGDPRFDQGPNRGSRPLSREDWDLALEAYRANPSVRGVLAAIPHGRPSAERLVNVGVPELGLPPIRKVLEEEARLAALGEKRLERVEAKTAGKLLEARMTALRKAEEARLAILGDAQKQREEEAKLVRMNRQGAVVLAAVQGKLLGGALRMAEALERDLSEGKGTIKERLGYLRTIANIVQRTAESSAKAVQMERLLLGEPTSILGVQGQGKPSEDMSPEEAGQWLEAANRAFAKARARKNVIEAEVVDVEE